MAPVLTRTFLDIRNALEVIVSEEAVITVSTSPSFATMWLVPRLLEFYAKHPKHRVQLDTTTHVINLKQDRRVDIAIRYGQGQYDSLDATPLFDETFGAYLSPSLFPPDQKLADLTLIETAWQQDVLTDINWKDWLKAANINITNPTIVRFDEEEHVLQAAIAGQGVALASSILAADLVNRNLLTPHCSEIQLKGAVYTALCLPEQRSAKKVNIFLDWLEQG